MPLRPLHITLVASEVKPFSKTGGLGDVTGALPGALGALGHTVTVFTPLHQKVDPQEHNLKRLLWRQKIVIDNKTYLYNVWQGQLSNQKVYFIDNYEFFRKRHKLYGYHKDGNLRYYFFNRAVLETVINLNIHPDIFHCHDWQAGLIPNLVESEAYFDYFAKTATVFTIHNILYQQAMDITNRPTLRKDRGQGLPKETLRDIRKINFLLRGIVHADVLSTVSEQYAAEIQTPEYGYWLNQILYKRRRRLFGILNGIDYNHFDPSHDRYLKVKYHLDELPKKLRNKRFLQEKLGLEADDNIPIIGMASRITEQKGFKLLFDIIDQLMTMRLQLVIVGSGYTEYEKIISKYQKKYPKQIGVHLSFSEEVASWIYAGSDIFLMPSRFEPCGLGQMIALRYGTIPVVHNVGGLADTITDYDPRKKKGNGFVFEDFTSLDLLHALTRALETYKYRDRWDKLIRYGMKQSYSWELPAKQYIKLFRIARQKHRLRSPVKFKPSQDLIRIVQ